MTRPGRLLVVVLLLGATLAVRPLGGQDRPPPVAEAERLADQERYGEAADLLLAHLRGSSDDPGVRWRAAQLLHWAGRTEEAAEQYRRVLGARPGDPWLRLEHADLLMTLTRLAEAEAVVRPVADDPAHPVEARARASALLGTLAYWRGDLAEATARLERAVELDPGRREAAETLGAVRALIRPWMRVGVAGQDDNQPYRRGHAELAGGLFLTPLWSLEAELTPRVLDPSGASAVDGPGDGVSGTEDDPTTAGEGTLTLRGFVPAARLELHAGGGAALQGDRSTWIGAGGLAVRLGGGGRVGLRGERERYLWTPASADTLLMVERVEAFAGRPEAPGWAGEAALRGEWFPDGNRIATAYGWVLAPLASAVRVGASASRADADESRWIPARQRYGPYYTPRNQRELSLLAELLVPVDAARLRISGSWGAWAREEAPTGTTSPGPGAPGLPTFFERSYTPWSLRGSLQAPASDGLVFHLEAEHRETAFYAADRISLRAVVRFGGPR